MHTYSVDKRIHTQFWAIQWTDLEWTSVNVWAAWPTFISYTDTLLFEPAARTRSDILHGQGTHTHPAINTTTTTDSGTQDWRCVLSDAQGHHFYDTWMEAVGTRKSRDALSSSHLQWQHQLVVTLLLISDKKEEWMLDTQHTKYRNSGNFHC